MSANAWVACGPSMWQAFDSRWEAENASPPESYSGPMDDESYRIMNTVTDVRVSTRLFRPKTVGAAGQNPFINYSMKWPTVPEMQTDLDYLIGAWPGKQFEVNGAWDMTTGFQVGQEGVYDEEGNLIGIEGDPLYPILDDAYKLMPDIVEYDDEGNEISRTPATSNADLRDINITLGQTPRDFTV